MDTLGNIRTEVQKRLWDGKQDTTAPSTFIDDLIYGNIENRDNLRHQSDVAQKDAVAKYIVVKVAENALDDDFRLVKRIGDEEEIMPEAKAALKRLDWKRWYTEALISERKHGHGYVYTGPNKYRQDWIDAGLEGGNIGGLDAFTAMNAKVLNNDVDENGIPTHITVAYNAANEALTDRLPYEDFIPICTRPKGRSPIEGYHAMYAVWTELAYIRISKHALNFAHGKWGLGALLFWSKGTLSAEVTDQIETMLENFSNSRAGLINADDIEKAEWTGPTGGGTTDIAQGIDMYLGLVSAGTGIPKDILTGISAGAITGSEINNKALYATLNQVQKSVEPFIRELISRMGINGEYEIDWNTRYATDEKEQAEIEVSHVSAQVARLQYYTMNEVRAIDNMGPVEGGDETPGKKDDFNIGFSGLEEPTSPEEQEQTRNRDGKQIG